MFEMMVLAIFLGLALAWALLERSTWLPRLAEHLVRTLALQYPRRPEVREQEWLGILDLKTTGWSKLGYALGCMWTTLRGQENLALTLLGLFLPTFRLFARPYAAYIIVSIFIETVTNLLHGNFNNLIGALASISFLSLIFPKDKIADFAWFPEWQYPPKVVNVLMCTLLLGLIGLMITGSTPIRIVVGGLLLSLALSVTVRIRSLLKQQRG